MNTNTAVIVGGVVIVLLFGGVFLYLQNNPYTAPTTATSTSTVDTTNSGGVTPSPTPPVAGSPTATTNQNVNPTDTTAVVVGGVVPNGAFTTYWYEYGASANLGLTSASQNVGSGYVELAAPTYITGLTKDTIYYFRLVAQNQFGKSTGATYTLHTTVGVAPPIGSAPTTKTLAASGVSRTTANINGQVTPNKSSAQYWFEYGKTQGLGQVTSVQSVGSGSVMLPASSALSGLDPLTTYYFRLNAQNQFGTVNGSILTFKTSGPAALVAPTVTTRSVSAVSTSTATLRGSIGVSSETTYYWFEYSTDAAFGSSLLQTTPQKTVTAGTNTVLVEATVSALQSGATYYYRTVGQNSVGTVRGASVSFKTK